MSAERALLARLAEGPVSGSALARETGLTRAAIWKRIEALREAGLEIEAQAGQGYHLTRPPHWLSASAILEGISPSVREDVADLEVAWSLDSTNAELLRRLTPEHGVSALLAEAQTLGRGRRGRQWNSPLGAHIYLSLARQFSGGLARLGGLSLVVGIAAVEALQREGFPQLRLKWPNDLVVEDQGGLRKLGGLLIEGGGEYAGPARAVIGLGVNVSMPAASAQGIDQPWIDLQSLANAPMNRDRLVSALIEALVPVLEQFDTEGLAPFLSRWSALDVLEGRLIDVHDAQGMQCGIAKGIASDGALCVEVEGQIKWLHAGEVRVRAR